MRKDVMAGAAAVGAALIGGAALYYYREKQTEEPDYRAIATDGDFQIRDYPALTVAETVVEGPRKESLSEGFALLADYIFAKSRELPEPPEGIELVEIPARRVAVVSFAGRPGDIGLTEQEDRLRGWLARRGETSEAEPEYAFYNSPVIPGPLRRNEVWLALS
jgi:DNA gyrase inhibitor GyrI